MIIDIADSQTKASASIHSDRGFNCFRFRAELDGRMHDLLWSEPGFETGKGSGDASGIPILFPFVGRMPTATFDFAGQSYRLAAGKGAIPIHGFVLDRPWRVIEQQADQVTGRFRLSQDAPERLKEWPADFELTATYQLHGGKLIATFTIANVDDHPLPCGLGWHPYFNTPRSDGNATQLKLKAAREWEMIDLRLTGRKIVNSHAHEMSKGMPLGEIDLDNIFTELSLNNRGRAEAELATEQYRVKLEFDASLAHCVVYTPPHRQAVCIEPWSTVPDCFRLESKSIPTGLSVLKPGEHHKLSMELACRSTSD